MEKANDRPLIHLHWALVVSLIYLIILGHPAAPVPAAHLLYVMVLLGGSLLILRLPFSSPEAFGATLVAFDTSSALLGLALNPSTSQDFLIGYFLCIVVASLGDSQGRLAGAALLVAGTYAIWLFQGREAFQTSPMLLRLPFLFVATVFYGVVMQRVRGVHQYRQVFEASPRPIWVYDESTLQFLAVNDAAVRDYGYSRGEFLAMTLKDIRPEEELPKLLETLSRVPSRLTLAGQFRHHTKDGTVIDVDIVSQPVRFAGRSARLVIITDITASKRAEESARRFSQRYQELFEGIPLGGYRTTAASVFEDVNPAFARILGYPDRDTLRRVRMIDIYVDPTDRARLIELLDRQGVAGGFETAMRRFDGSLMRASVSARVVRADSGEIVGYEGIVEDISDRKRAEGALKEALRKSEQSDQLKSSFLANMSHEIRTPLNVILGYNEIIREAVAPQDPSLGEMIDAIQRASERLLGTVHGVLDLAKLQSGSLDCRPMPLELTAVIAELVRRFEPRARVKGLSLTSSIEVEGAVVLFDEYCLSTALHNLLDNAIKFTTAGEVSLRLYRGDGEELLLEIRDTGIGIAETYLPRLFEHFTQEDSGDARSFEGTGVGLAVTKGLLEHNRAQVSMQTAKGKGTTFRIRFDPLTEVHPSPGADGTKPPGLGNGKPMVLVVEDDTDNQLYVETILGRSYRILSASTGEELRDALAGHVGEIRAVLMDVTLRGKEDGLSLTRYLRSRPEWRDVPVVATTAHDLPEWRLEAFEAGCDAFLSKPFTPRQLLSIVDGFVTPA
jgi:two-component system, sensor histidine kinase and response regulator